MDKNDVPAFGGDGSGSKRPFLRLQRVTLRAVVQLTTLVWRSSGDWRFKRALLTRLTAHCCIVALALTVLGLNRIPPSTALGAGTFRVLNALPAGAESAATPQPTAPASVSSDRADASIARLALLHTTIPDRPRTGATAYQVEVGDNIYAIAEKFALSPYTVVWSNWETLQGTPWFVEPGLILNIPPTDGVYHTVTFSDTLPIIAETYRVEVPALFNQWNDLDIGRPELHAGQQLFVEGGMLDVEIEWVPPAPAPGVGASSYASGFCDGYAVSGIGANGWFVLPTGSPYVSGWYFRDPGNPGHIGLDYGCSQGAPIYAADSGVVVYAGWGGGYGNLIRIDHGNGYQTYYAHLSDYAVGCGPVYQGQLIGYCGNTGASYGAHLHYEIRLNGTPQDPLWFQ